ncbi:sulfopyruvate decarboxylase subunit beta [Sulfuriferula plumbiphila]|uniref:Sulfopyruvate decarboxylase subunit beta n=1 Tax=Sulfuriferula plumbiphila TaxID=171865 RepID=A0A512L6W4_9PROT|nr:thiamine pyrophosphate-dependent enzyme [Sulfuriferula plumbiphila]BBP02941.1 sulfopyruvate decarboxylase subunit beta [Sulfuriferula plumbiphila]GEP30192.1 sulfopyruvate decarboxylase subunit beta [Sulfuriferula plumbiphila]
MTRTDCLKAIFAAAPEAPVVLTTGYTCRDAFAFNDREGSFYMVGSMGLAGSIGIGVALCTRLPTIVVDGDGALLMNPGNLFLAAHLRLANLVHLVLDNRSYESTGGQKSIADSVDFAKVALHSGYRFGETVTTLPDFERLLKRVLVSGSGPALIHAVLDGVAAPIAPRIPIPLREISKRFRRFLTERAHLHAQSHSHYACNVRSGSE